VSKKLQKKRPTDDGGGGGLQPHSPTMEYPEHLGGLDSDEEEDVRVPPQGNGMFMNMNQSIFGLIAAAGSRVDFHDRFDGQSSDEDEADSGTQLDGTGILSKKEKGKEREVMAQTTVLKGHGDRAKDGKHHRRKLSDTKLLRSLPSLKTRFSTRSRKSAKSKEPEIKEEEGDTDDSGHPTAGTDEHSLEVAKDDGRLPPVMSRMLEAKAEMAARPSFDLDRLVDKNQDGGLGDVGPSMLSKRLMEIFMFDEPEAVIEEYPCWLLQSVLLQGYMYITAKHICFYAYLPKKAVSGATDRHGLFARTLTTL